MAADNVISGRSGPSLTDASSNIVSAPMSTPGANLDEDGGDSGDRSITNPEPLVSLWSVSDLTTTQGVGPREQVDLGIGMARNLVLDRYIITL